MPSGSHTVSPELWQTTKAVRGTEPGQYRGDTGPWKEQWEGLQRASSICPELEDSTGHLSEQVTTRGQCWWHCRFSFSSFISFVFYNFLQ